MEVIPLPEEVLKKIYEAAQIGDFQVIKREAQSIKRLAAKYVRLVTLPAGISCRV